jgi:hypothetical protein
MLAVKRLKVSSKLSSITGTAHEGRLTSSDDLVRAVQILSGGHQLAIHLRGSESLSLVAAFWDSVKRFLETNNPDYLKPFVNVAVTDADGLQHVFETRPNVLYRFSAEF